MSADPHAEVDVDAPLEQVWATVLDTAAYAEWNPFIVRAECHSPPRVGDPIRLHVRFRGGGRATSPERITVVEAPYDDGGVTRAVLAYAFEGWPARLGLVRSTRWQRLSQVPGGPTRYETVGELRGPLVRLAGPGRVQDGFERQAAALKNRCEGHAPPTLAQ